MNARIAGLLLAACISLSGCDGLQTSPTAGAPGTPPAPGALTAAPISSVTPTNAGCYYVWASRDLPDLSGKFSETLQAADRSMIGSAYAYGEECVFADGSSTFSAMETDFRVRIRVSSLRDEDKLGDRIATVMTRLQTVLEGEVPGPRPGRVEFEFYTSAGTSLHLNVGIEQYRQDGKGLGGAQLFRLFYKVP